MTGEVHLYMAYDEMPVLQSLGLVLDNQFFFSFS